MQQVATIRLNWPCELYIIHMQLLPTLDICKVAVEGSLVDVLFPGSARRTSMSRRMLRTQGATSRCFVCRYTCIHSDNCQVVLYWYELSGNISTSLSCSNVVNLSVCVETQLSILPQPLWLQANTKLHQALSGSSGTNCTELQKSFRVCSHRQGCILAPHRSSKQSSCFGL